MSFFCLNPWLRWWQRTDLKRPLWAQTLLKGLSLFYGLGQRVHQQACLFKRKKAPLPVISIGSVCAGGSGKTPLCCWLYDHLQKKMKPLVVMRGYMASSEQDQNPCFVQSTSSSFVGDEAWMLSGLHQSKIALREVILSSNRWRGCQKGFEQGFDVALLDDGMQHYRLYRDIELVLLDPEDLNQGLLPAGRRRESWSALQRADWIVFRSKNPIEESLRVHWGIIDKPFARFSYAIAGWRGAQFFQKDHAFLSKKKLGVCTGIARPQNFLNLLKAEKLEPVEQYLLADHENLDPQWLKNCERQWKAKGIERALCTEKDYARWSQQAPLSDFWVYPELVLDWHESEKALLDWMFERLLSLKTKL